MLNINIPNTNDSVARASPQTNLKHQFPGAFQVLAGDNFINPILGTKLVSIPEIAPARNRSFNDKLMFSSKSDLWSTPQEFYNELNQEFGFDLDVCALPSNAKCQRYYTPDVDGLSQPWTGTCWCNPPYGRDVGRWVQRAAEAAAEGAVVVMLLPARTDTRWFHAHIYQKPGVEIRFVKGRLKFGGNKNAAPFPSMVVIFRRPTRVKEFPKIAERNSKQNETTRQ